MNAAAEAQRTKQPLYKLIATAVDAALRTEHVDPAGYVHDAWREVIKACEELLPSGSGFDCGTKIDLTRSTGERLYFTTQFHHMDANGFYVCWSDMTIKLSPSLLHGYTLWINFHGHKRAAADSDYFYDVFNGVLSEPTDISVTAQPSWLKHCGNAPTNPLTHPTAV